MNQRLMGEKVMIEIPNHKVPELGAVLSGMPSHEIIALLCFGLSWVFKAGLEVDDGSRSMTRFEFSRACAEAVDSCIDIALPAGFVEPMPDNIELKDEVDDFAC